jgi:hypothetical protein
MTEPDIAAVVARAKRKYMGTSFKDVCQLAEALRRANADNARLRDAMAECVRMIEGDDSVQARRALRIAAEALRESEARP